MKSAPGVERHEWTAPIGQPWRLEGLMRQMYKRDKMSQNAIADEFDCSQRTVKVWLKKHDIPIRSKRESYHLRDDGVQHYFNDEGYEYIRTEHNHRSFSAPVHKLVAIAHGADADEMFNGDLVVHHENGMKADNRPENLDWSMTNKEHALYHAHDSEETA